MCRLVALFFKKIFISQGWACGPSAFRSEFILMCRLVALFFKKIYIFLSH